MTYQGSSYKLPKNPYVSTIKTDLVNQEERIAYYWVKNNANWDFRCIF